MFSRNNSYSSQIAPNRRRFFTLLIMGLAFIMLVVGATSLIKQSGEKKVADTFINAVYTGDGGKSYKLGSPVFKGTTTQENWNSRVASVRNFYKDKPKYVRSSTELSEGGSSQTKVYYTIEGISSDYDAQVWLSKYESGWQVDYFGVAPRN
jgi:hypothetical protein